MALKLLSLKYILLYLCVVFTTATFIIFYELNHRESCNCQGPQKKVSYHIDSHKLAILVPFRDRFTELLKFVPAIHKFLEAQKINFEIFILNQVDEYRFNRASLLNVGFHLVRDKFDYVALHDVDLVPTNPDLSYKYPKTGIYHVASPEYHPKYNYATFLGGILLITRSAFEELNGMSNQYWGWGLEDDEFYARVQESNFVIERPANLTTSTKTTFSHIHSKFMRRRDMAKCYNQWEVTRKRDRKTGYRTVKYSISQASKLTIQGIGVDIINVELVCNRTETPWCDCRNAKTDSARSKSADNHDVIVPVVPRKASN